MQLPRKSVLAGALLGLIPIGLGIAALVTPQWIKSQPGNYSLLICNNDTECLSGPEARTTRGLEIAGVAAIVVGVVIALVLDIFTKNRWIHLLSQIMLIAGPILILIGVILYGVYVFEDLTKKLPGLSNGIPLELGYSIILIVVTCILGFLTAIYFAFVTGFGRHPVHHPPHRHLRTPRTSAIVVVQESERF